MRLSELVLDPVIIVLLLSSLVSWWIIIDRWVLLVFVTRADRTFYHGKNPSTAPLAKLHGELERHADIGRDDLLLSLDAGIELQRHRLEKRMPLLGAIGSAAPYVGLLGTVIGIIKAFQNIQAHNNMSPSVVSGGIALALVATASGLAVAIPAVVGHHLLSAAINRHAALWEAVVAKWISELPKKDTAHESVPVA